jgi:carbamoyltransferase
MTKILGISAFYHDSAAALIENGKIIAAAQEERFSRKKHDDRFPKNAIKFLLNKSKCN